MPAGIGRRYVGDMFAAIGRMTPRGKAAGTAAMMGSMPVGMRGSMASRVAARNAAHITAGKKVTGYGMVGASAISMMATNRSTGAYKPAPINPISSPQGSGRYA
jgi:5-formaminoimidazole-4-carboxamide-1-beta-D-ribofuranosyl 5'-monophosphate synthetase